MVLCKKGRNLTEVVIITTKYDEGCASVLLSDLTSLIPRYVHKCHQIGRYLLLTILQEK